jgi:hypothetical protein
VGSAWGPRGVRVGSAWGPRGLRVRVGTVRVGSAWGPRGVRAGPLRVRVRSACAARGARDRLPHMGVRLGQRSRPPALSAGAARLMARAAGPAALLKLFHDAAAVHGLDLEQAGDGSARASCRGLQSRRLLCTAAPRGFRAPRSYSSTRQPGLLRSRPGVCSLQRADLLGRGV